MYILIYLILFFHKISLLKNKSFISKKIKWPFYFSSLFAEVISLLNIYIILVEYIGCSFSDFISFCMFCIFVIVENIIFLIVGIVICIKENKKKKTIKRKKKISYKLSIMTVILSFVGTCLTFSIFSALPVFYKSDIEKYIEDSIIEYLESKYGDGDFKVKTISKEYSGGLFGESEEFTGYTSYVKTSYLKNDYIYVSIDGIDKESITISYDSFIGDYYDKDKDDTIYYFEYINGIKESRVKDEYKNRFNIDIDGYYHSYEVPFGFGRIPTEEELIDFTKIMETSIDLDLSNISVSIDDKFTYLYDITKFSIDYLELNSDFEIDIKWDNKRGYIKCENDVISISLDGDVKTYSRSEFK